MDKIKELQGTNMDTRIFMAKENDFETVKDITQTTIKLVYPKYYPEGAVQFFCNHHADDRILNDIAAGKVYLLEVDDVCVGTVTISNNEICRLFVLPEYQHKGYGRLLMDYAEKMISKTNKTVVLDASFPAKKIYIKRGYEPTEYNMIETENGDYLCFDVMEKSI
jgi:GNAT superfamily N-acetyltransferase